MKEKPARGGLSREAWVALSGIAAAIITGLVTLVVHFIPAAQDSSGPTVANSPEISRTASAGATMTIPPTATATATPSPRDRSPDADGSNTFTALREANVDFTVPEKDLKQWLMSPESTPYPSIADALLRLLADQRLREPVAIDAIVHNYEHTPGESSPRRVEDVDPDVLRAAVLEGFNSRYNASAASFEDLLEQRPA